MCRYGIVCILLQSLQSCPNLSDLTNLLFIRTYGTATINYTAILDYQWCQCCHLPAATLAPLQRVLHAAARLVLDLKPRDHVIPALRELHWLPVVLRIEYKLCLLVHKALIGQAPEYIINLLIQHSITLCTACLQQRRPLPTTNRVANW